MKETQAAPDNTKKWWGIRIPRKDKKIIKKICDIKYIMWLLTTWNTNEIELNNEKYKIYIYSNYYNTSYNPFNFRDFRYKKGGYRIWKLK